MWKILKSLCSVNNREFLGFFKGDFSKHLSYKTVTKDLINKGNTVKSK